MKPTHTHVYDLLVTVVLECFVYRASIWGGEGGRFETLLKRSVPTVDASWRDPGTTLRVITGLHSSALNFSLTALLQHSSYGKNLATEMADLSMEGLFLMWKDNWK